MMRTAAPCAVGNCWPAEHDSAGAVPLALLLFSGVLFSELYCGDGGLSARRNLRSVRALTSHIYICRV